MAIHRYLICIALLLTSTWPLKVAQAAARPSPGLWWQPGHNGLFMSVHIGPADYALIMLTSGQGGSPTYRVLQGPLDRVDDGRAIARLSSPLYRVDGADCLGCPPTPAATIAEDEGEYRIEFLSGTTAVLHAPDGLTVDYELFPLYTSSVDELAARLPGRVALFESPATSGEPIRRSLVDLVALAPEQRTFCAALFDPDETVLLLRARPGSISADPCFTQSYLGVSPGPTPRIRMISEAVLPICAGQANKIGVFRSCVPSAQLSESGRVLSGESLLRPSGAVSVTILD
ncbi:MAG: hypothetical protein R3F15_12275 [Lysobacterales bacterium]